MRKKGDMYAMITAFACYTIFGFSYLFSKNVLAYTLPAVFLAVRFLLAFAVLNLMLLTGRYKLQIKASQLKWLLGLGLVNPVGYFLCENYALLSTDISFVGMFAALIPIGGVFFGFVLLRERPTKIQMAFCCLSVAGVTIATAEQLRGSATWYGIALLVGMVAAAALTSIISKKAGEQNTVYERTYVMFGFSALVFTVLALFQVSGDIPGLVLAPMSRPSFWGIALYLAILSSVVAYSLLNYASSHLSIARVSIFANITTVISILTGVLILHEQFTLLKFLGAVLIIVGVYGVNRWRRPEAAAPHPNGDAAAPVLRTDDDLETAGGEKQEENSRV